MLLVSKCLSCLRNKSQRRTDDEKENHFQYLHRMVCTQTQKLFVSVELFYLPRLLCGRNVLRAELRANLFPHSIYGQINRIELFRNTICSPCQRLTGPRQGQCLQLKRFERHATLQLVFFFPFQTLVVNCLEIEMLILIQTHDVAFVTEVAVVAFRDRPRNGTNREVGARQLLYY